MLLGGAPALLKLTEPMVSPFCSPVLVNSVPANVKVCPYVLLWPTAVMLDAAGLTVLDGMATFTEVAGELAQTTLPE